MVTTTDTTARTLDREELLAELFPDANAHCYLQLRAGGAHEWFRFFPERGWRQWGSFRAGSEPEMTRLITMNGNWDVSFMPMLWQQPAEGAPLRSTTRSLWVGLPARLEPQRKHEPGARRAEASVAEARSRLAAAAIAPSITVDEGYRISGVWTLSEAIPLDTATLLLGRITRRLSGDYELLDLGRAAISLPGTLVSGLFPTHTVSASAVTPPPPHANLAGLTAWLVA